MENKKPVFTVLCVDGGGARGLIPARILKEIEQRTGKPTCENFDWMCGTSTGSIIVSALNVRDPENPGKPKYSAEDIENFYLLHLPNIFRGGFTERTLNLADIGGMYNPTYLCKALQRAFGDAQLKDSLTSISIPVTDSFYKRPVYLENIKGIPDKTPEQFSTIPMWEAAYASSAAPILLPARDSETTPDSKSDQKVKHTLIDGSMFAGNVPHDLLEKAKRQAPPDAEIIFVHIGTGTDDFSKTADELNRTTPLNRIEEIMHLSVELSSQAALRSIKNQLGGNMFSFDDTIVGKKPALKAPGMAAATKAEHEYILEFADRIIKKNNQSVDQLCKILVERTVNAFAVYENNSPEFHKIIEELVVKDTVGGLVDAFAKANQTSRYNELPDREKDDVQKIVVENLVVLRNKSKTTNAFLEMVDAASEKLQNLPLPGNDNNRRPKHEKKLSGLSRLARVFVKFAQRFYAHKPPELEPLPEKNKKQNNPVIISKRVPTG